MRVLVTGATGFVGRHVLERLAPHHSAVAALLNEEEREHLPKGVEGVVVGDIGAYPDWGVALKGVEGVIHLAARAHILNDTHPNAAGEFLRINAQGTAQLAHAAAEAGVKRFVFVSTIGVHGDGQGLDLKAPPYRESDTPAPHDAYSMSKLTAEDEIQSISDGKDMDYAIIRPPLVYGPGVPGNFRELLKWVARGVPLPLGGVKNRRSFIGVRNLADALVVCLEHPKASNQTFVIADGEDYSTPELYRALATGMGRDAKLPTWPPALLKLTFKAMRREKTFVRLCGSLAVDATKIRETLGWSPPVSASEGLAETARWFAETTP